MMKPSTSRSSKKHATGRDCATTSQTAKHQSGTVFAAPNVQNTFTSVPFAVTIETPPNTSNMKFGQLSEQLDKWVKELLDSERDFVEMVTQLNATDRMVFQNISNLGCLHQNLIKLGKSQVDMSSELNRIGCELLLTEEAVRNMENVAEAKQLCQAVGKASDPCSIENLRKNLYNFMIQMNSDLNYSTERLSEVIQASSFSKNPGVGTNPVQQIGYILNHHYECLVDIENAYDKCKTALENVRKIQNQMMSSSLNTKP